MNNLEDLQDAYLNGIFFITLTVTSNFIVSVTGCKQRNLLNNPYIKNFFIIFMIYFYTYKWNDSLNPLYQLSNTIFMWMVFLIFEKLDSIYVLILLITVFILMVSRHSRNYYNIIYNLDDSDKNDNYNYYFDKLIQIEIIIVTLIIIIGMIDYTMKYNHLKDKSIGDYLFPSKVRC